MSGSIGLDLSREATGNPNYVLDVGSALGRSPNVGNHVGGTCGNDSAAALAKYSTAMSTSPWKRHVQFVPRPC